MQKIYITGVCGMLGYNIALGLKGKYDLYGADIVPIPEQDYPIEYFDLLDFSKLRESIKKAEPDVVVHTAAAVNVDRCEMDRKFAYELNTHLTQEIAKVCGENGIKLIYISTDAVFDGEKDGLYQETDLPEPVNYYGETKLLGEKYVQECKNSLILRTNIYGRNIQNKCSFGEWIVESLRRGEELNMFTDIFFSPILVNELTEIIDACIEKNVSGLYHACGTGKISKYDFGMAVKEVFGIQSGVIHATVSEIMEFKARRSKNMGMDNGKLRNELGMDISTPMESIMRFKSIYDTWRNI
jgi:dTDP-4-dehydrorhamnose reductase